MTRWIIWAAVAVGVVAVVVLLWKARARGQAMAEAKYDETDRVLASQSNRRVDALAEQGLVGRQNPDFTRPRPVGSVTVDLSPSLGGRSLGM